MTWKKMRTLFFLAAFLWGCAFLSFGKTGSASTLKIAVSILPQKYFVEKIGGNYVSVTVMVPPGADPHSYEPKPRQMVTLSESQIYFTIGIQFDRTWVKRIIASNKNIRVFAMDSNIEKIPMAPAPPEKKQKQVIHRDSFDPHIWLSPPLVKKIAVNIARALVEVDPVHAKEYQVNLSNFRHEIDQLHTFIQSKLRGEKNSSFLVVHPAWGYFARTYQLHQVPIEMGGKEPNPRELAYLINFAKKQSIKVIFSEPQFSPRIAEIIAKQIHGKVASVDPLALDWEDNLKNVATVIGKALEK